MRGDDFIRDRRGCNRNDGSLKLLVSTANCIARSHFRKFLHTLLIPVDYTRTKEIPALLRVSGILERKGDRLRILDVASPQILSLSLARSSELWDLTYVNPFEAELEDLRQKASLLGLSRLKIVNGDITRPETLSHLGSFDYIFSCSVFEHIHPEEGGDVTAAKNIKPLLDDKGLFAFTVPYYKEKFNEYVEGDVYAVKGIPSRKTFFQRFYDESSLQDQILVPTGLKLLRKSYIGERRYREHDIHKRMAFLIGFGWAALLLGRFFGVISDLFMEQSEDFTKLKKPYLAICALAKEDVP